MKKYKLLILFLFLFSINQNYLFAQFEETIEKSDAFFFDAVCFKHDNDTNGRVDVFVIVPYQTLYFSPKDEYYGAKYDVLIKLYDNSGDKVEEKLIRRNITESDYFVSQGGTGKFDQTHASFTIPKGNYQVSILVSDGYSKKSFLKSRMISIINFSDFKFAISGIMLLSSIEEKNGKYLITPHLSDNIGGLGDGFFVFFEVYNFSNIDSADFVYEIVSGEDTISKSTRQRRFIGSKTTRHYLRITIPSNVKEGSYTLRILALSPSDSQSYSDSDYLAIAERSIKVYRIISGYSTKDLNKAIKELRYVADQSDIDKMEEAQTPEEKQKLFEEFWRNTDPSPNTERNEAYEEYYLRIDYANANFRSYTEGWLSDMGSVYIVYGKPFNVEKYEPYGDNRRYERWTYQNNRQFIFADNTGFGDYHLTSPYTVSEKYKYGR